MIRRANSFPMCQFVYSLLLLCGVVEAQTKNLVTVESGSLPIILSAPHGGRKAIPGVNERRGDGVRSFKKLSDTNTDYLAEKLADEIEKKTGKRPYLVIARFHRKYLDANRSPANAYESENAKLSYETYHESLLKARTEIMKKWGSGLLLDLHGQASEPQKIIRGTQNGKSVKHLIDLYGPNVHYGTRSLFGQFAEQDLQVFPKVDSQQKEHPNFDGGFITVTYGSQPGEPFDAIQIEVGREMRVPWRQQKIAEKLAQAIVQFAEDYLPSAVATSQ